MKVILTEDVYKHGVAGEVVSVADGFARNYLIPQNKAVKATPGSLKRMEKLRAEAAKRRQLRNEELEQLAEKVKALTLSFPVKAGESGKLYGSVTSGHISEAIEQELGISIDHRRVGEQPLRELGQHHVVVRLSGSLAPAVTVLVHREGEPPESVLDIVPSGEAEEELTIFDEVMDEEADEAVAEAEMEFQESWDDATGPQEEIPPEADTTGGE